MLPRIDTRCWRQSRVLKGLGVCLLLLGSAYLCSQGRWSVGSGAGAHIPTFLEQPRSAPVYPIQGTKQWSETLPAAALAVKPYFRDNKIPIALIYHALRVWGPRVPFEPSEVAAKWDGIKRDHLFLDILTNDALYERYSRFTIDRLLDRSPLGVRIVTAGDAGWHTEWASTHVGKYVQVMADLEIPSSVPLQLRDGGATLADALRDETLRYDYSQESEWICCGLPRYLSTPRWRNRFDDEITLDELVTRLAGREFGQGACYGTHVPMALAVILGVNRNAERPLIHPETERRISTRLIEISELLTHSQASDGSWSPDWHKPSSRIADSPQSYRRNNNLRVAVTGHHLEWMTHCPPQLRPGEDCLAAAALFLSRRLPQQKEEIELDFHAYAPATHAVRALLNACERRWAEPTWLADSVPTR
jgi:hypothetical protein